MMANCFFVGGMRVDVAKQPPLAFTRRRAWGWSAMRTLRELLRANSRYDTVDEYGKIETVNCAVAV